MDYNHICTNSAGNMSPSFGNEFTHDPPFYPEPYHRRNGSFVDTPSFITPKFSRHSNFPPEPYSPSVENRNVLYHPYKPHCTSFHEADCRGFLACHDWHCSESEGKCLCCSQIMHPNTERGNCHGIINPCKSTVSRKRKKLPKSKPQENFPVLNSDKNQTNYATNTLGINRQENCSIDAINNSHQTNSTANAAIHYVPNKEILVNIKDKNDSNELPIANEQKYFANDWSREGIIETTVNKTKTSMIYANETENMNSTSENISLNPEYQNDPLLNNGTNELEASTDLLLTAMTAAGISSLQSGDTLDLSSCQTSFITTPENTNSNIQNIQQEILQYTDIEGSFFKPVFEGKNENGEDIVILLVGQDIQNIQTNAETFEHNENLNAEIDQNIVLNFTENNLVSDQTSSEFHFDSQQLKEECDEHSKDMFFSHMDDHACEEIATMSKTPKTKKKKKEKDISTDRYQEITAVGNDSMSSWESEPSTSREVEMFSTNTVQTVNSSLKKLKSRKRNLQWIKRFQWRSKEPFFNIQRQYFKKIGKRAKMENEPLMKDERFWNMYRIIVNKVGSSVMEAMYRMLPALIHVCKASEQKVNVIP